MLIPEHQVLQLDSRGLPSSFNYIALAVWQDFQRKRNNKQIVSRQKV